MTEPSPLTASDRAQLLAAGRLEDARGELEATRAALALAPRWRPARGLMAQCDEAIVRIEEMRVRMRRKLVVAIVGPTGAGKSTLLSALAGVDELSPSGVERPTTREVVVYCREREDAEPLIERLGEDTRVTLRPSPAAVGLEHLLLVDTPDFNSALEAEHRPIVEAVVRQADVLLCVFNAENPKTRANIEFLAPLVASFPSRFVLAVLNHCDRQDEAELKTDIQPDFVRTLSEGWDRAPAGVFCVSARRHLRRPDWPAGAAPRHEFDEFPRLREALFGSLNRASAVLDARVERARHLASAVREAVAERATALDAAAGDVDQRLRRLRSEALGEAAGGLGEAGAGVGVGTMALFYQRLANAWWGPVGWLVGIWARLLIVGAGFANVLRFGRPLRQLWAVVTSIARFKQTQESIGDAERGHGTDLAAMRYRARYEREWPALADALVAGGFDPAVRDAGVAVPTADALDQALSERWSSALGAQLDRATDTLSAAWLQLVLNGLVLLPMLAVAVRSVTSFVAGELLSGDYFRHAFLTILLLWVLAFVFFQMGARALGGRRLLRRTFAALLEAVREGPDALGDDALAREVAAVRRLRQA